MITISLHPVQIEAYGGQRGDRVGNDLNQHQRFQFQLHTPGKNFESTFVQGFIDPELLTTVLLTLLYYDYVAGPRKFTIFSHEGIDARRANEDDLPRR